MTPSDVYVLGAGMLTPVGDEAGQTRTSVNAGISRAAESAVYNRRYQPLTMALLPEEHVPPLAPGLDAVPLTSRQARMLRLAAPALREALAPAPEEEPIPLFLGVPEAHPGLPDPVGKEFLSHLFEQCGKDVELDRRGSRILPAGRAAGMLAVAAAAERIGSGKIPLAIAGGVDSHLDLYLLGTLDREGRVLAEGIMDGFVPGEGACFLVLGSSEFADSESALAKIVAFGTGREAGHRYSEEPYLGEGLSEAFRNLFAAAGTQGPVQSVFAGLNGEHLGAKEWGTAAMRHERFLSKDYRLVHPAECFGDAGAALGALLVGLAAMGLGAGDVKGPALCWCGSDLETRVAMLLDAV